jgi:3alpha(or 20beta)-hydroxysteroid dehydrogenase
MDMIDRPGRGAIEMFDDFPGKVAIVAGGAGAMGASQVRKLHADGARVVVADLNDAVGEGLEAELGSECRYVHADASSEADWARVVDTAQSAYGGVDLLSNSFGIAPACPFDELTLDEYMKTILVNQIGVFLGMKAVCSPMIAQRSGAIVNFSSNSAILSQPFLAAYSASKAAVNAMTRSVAAEVGRYGIRVNTVSPGSVRSALQTATQKAFAESREGYDGRGMQSEKPLGRIGEPEELANMGLFLLSDASSYCTGGTFVVDGGSSSGRWP